MIVFYIAFKCEVYLVQRRCGLLLNAQIITHKEIDLIIGILLDFVPVFFVIDFLLSGRLSHQDIVSDLIAFRQIQTGRVQAFKYQLRIIVGIKANTDDLQASDCLKQLIYRNLFLLDAVVEIIVVCRQIRTADVFRLFVKELTKSLPVILDRFQLYAGFFRLIFVNQIIFIDTVTEAAVRRRNFPLADQIIHSKQKQ